MMEQLVSGDVGWLGLTGPAELSSFKAASQNFVSIQVYVSTMASEATVISMFSTEGTP